MRVCRRAAEREDGCRKVIEFGAPRSCKGIEERSEVREECKNASKIFANDECKLQKKKYSKGATRRRRVWEERVVEEEGGRYSFWDWGRALLDQQYSRKSVPCMKINSFLF